MLSTATLPVICVIGRLVAFHFLVVRLLGSFFVSFFLLQFVIIALDAEHFDFLTSHLCWSQTWCILLRTLKYISKHLRCLQGVTCSQLVFTLLVGHFQLLCILLRTRSHFLRRMGHPNKRHWCAIRSYKYSTHRQTRSSTVILVRRYSSQWTTAVIQVFKNTNQFISLI